VRLTQINLAGFKSFVDPTQIPVPGQLVGIVGPNGCGKSNIIDAVRWVLGETSAKHLRGESMQDVLFNGSGDRKPVNRCSVELVFDNSLGKASGQWSTYSEISIKRVLQRDGDSSYYINNIHVRRRDVTDLFLGTGLGARAYAIIEQGMISRVIEAKPEELRVFLEEAAGVSKYRERRRETENRLQDTRENLLRVDDIREELGKQLEHLQAQAEVAAQYHALQKDLLGTQQMWWLTKRREAAAARERHTREIERLEIEIEAETAALREAEKRLEELRDQHYRAGDAVHAAQGEMYEANSEVARLEQQIGYIRDKKTRIEHQVANLGSELAANESGLATAEQLLETLRSQHEHAAARVEESEAMFAEESEKLPLAEDAFRAALARRDEVQRQLSQHEQALQVEQTKLAAASRVLEQLGARHERLTEEQAGLPQVEADVLERAQTEAQEIEYSLQEQRAALADHEQELPRLEQALREQMSAWDAATQKATGIEARVNALQQLQDRIARGAGMASWLAARGLDQAPRLWQGITIEPGWEDALEAVLRERLNGITLDAFDIPAEWLQDAPPGKMTVVDGTGNEAAAAGALPGCEPLSRYVTCRNPGLQGALNDWLHDVYVVADVTTGKDMRAQLPAGGLLVTREGHLYSRHSLSFHAADSELHGVLSRQREIETLQGELEEQRAAAEAVQQQVSEAEAAIERHKTVIAEAREHVAQLQQRLHAIQIEAMRLDEQARRASERGEQIAAELAEISEQISHEEAQRGEVEARLETLTAAAEEARLQLDEAVTAHAEAQSALDVQREGAQNARHQHQEAQFELRTCTLRISEVENTIRSTTESIARVRAAIEEEQAGLVECDESQLQEQLQEALARQQTREQALAAARDTLETMETQLKAVDLERHTAEQKLDPLRNRVNDVKLKEQESRLTEEQYANQLVEAGANEEELTAQLQKGMRSGTFQQEINRLTEEIKALGAVNLAALEELQAAQERKNYLDAQSDDLTEAMTTLEDAIRRIDRETRERLQQTFDEVNAHFSRMFPQLFGGGQAKLVLSGEEILDSGVQVVAQPPGKKNASIHLLSGGEKALTAMALVFAIFQLNPAPFCLLDEVDAPLDDYNTGRYCDLVKKMSEQSQFLFISHNKITMEMAHQLLGITMNEPGVSRVVAVDIDSAMKMTEEAA